MATANWSYHLMKGYWYHPPWSSLDLFLFLFFSIQMNELNTNMGIPTPASFFFTLNIYLKIFFNPTPFKPLMVVLVSTIPSRIHDCFTMLARMMREGSSDKSFHTVLPVTVSFILEVRELMRGFFFNFWLYPSQWHTQGLFHINQGWVWAERHLGRQHRTKGRYHQVASVGSWLESVKDWSL